MSRSHSFPREFLWGASTAAYQIEGGALEGGRSPSIWDTFSHTEGRTVNGDTGDMAVDHFHRWRDDVAEMKKLGLGAYRFSISWPRVQPGGSGEFNPEGIAFYSDLVNELISAGIKPVATLYHWDLPQELEDDGGWANRNTAYRFAQYAEKMAHELGDRVTVWVTLNEPWCAAFLGYASGLHAPGRTDAAVSLAAAHHLNLAHGLAARAIRGVLGESTQLSISLNLHVARPADPTSVRDRDAARRIDAVGNRIFLGPVLEGAYPIDLLADTRDLTDWSFVQDGDLDLIQSRIDVLGVNYYATARVRYRDEPATPHPTPWVGATDVEFLQEPAPLTDMGWNIDPTGLTELLSRLAKSYPDLPLMITENGAAFPDELGTDGFIHDSSRIAYLRDHLDAVGDALDAGVDVRGYFVWSLMDNFEWSEGYSKRFGIIRIDYDTQERTWKDSAFWYRDLIASQTGLDQTSAT